MLDRTTKRAMSNRLWYTFNTSFQGYAYVPFNEF